MSNCILFMPFCTIITDEIYSINVNIITYINKYLSSCFINCSSRAYQKVPDVQIYCAYAVPMEWINSGLIRYSVTI
ncbi:MAG: hypothetical protein KAJ51_11700, partial [Thermoplasmata archaeon]|nr:hypothetical protein [Thermoplasmata archaeon]